MANNKLQKMTGAENFSAKQIEALKLAKAMFESQTNALGKYREFVEFAKDMLPKEITPVLIAAGFTKQRATEIKSVAMLPPEQIKPYVAGEIGFKTVLETARKERRKETGRKSKVDYMIPCIKAARRYLDKRGKGGARACLLAVPSEKAGVRAVIVLDGSKKDYDFTIGDLTITLSIVNAGAASGQPAPEK